MATKSPDTVYNDSEGNLKGQETEAQAVSRRAQEIQSGNFDPADDEEETPSVIADRQRMKDEEAARKQLLDQEKANEKAAKEEEKANA